MSDTQHPGALYQAWLLVGGVSGLVHGTYTILSVTTVCMLWTQTQNASSTARRILIAATIFTFLCLMITVVIQDSDLALDFELVDPSVLIFNPPDIRRLNKIDYKTLGSTTHAGINSTYPHTFLVWNIRWRLHRLCSRHPAILHQPCLNLFDRVQNAGIPNRAQDSE
ncbi:hypothetical protein C8J56DRAFT_394472 [Mycena floridula]|nr:hypothetical protein C8J56DRAFT_394472 [Mycena floridula]